MTEPEPDPAAPLSPCKLGSLLLQYPSPELQSALGSVGDRDLAALRRSRPAVRGLLEWYASASPADLCGAYSETFDFSKARSLHLTYHLHGDRRQRGIALLRLKQSYEAAGWELGSSELPDHLPLMLEFAALVPAAGSELLGEHSIPIALIRAALHKDDNVFAPALDLVAEQLPGLSARQVAKLRRLAASGPPTEQVGLEPFAPPEIMGDGGDGGMPLPMVGGRP